MKAYSCEFEFQLINFFRFFISSFFSQQIKLNKLLNLFKK